MNCLIIHFLERDFRCLPTIIVRRGGLKNHKLVHLNMHIFKWSKKRVFLLRLCLLETIHFLEISGIKVIKLQVKFKDVENLVVEFFIQLSLQQH